MKITLLILVSANIMHIQFLKENMWVFAILAAYPLMALQLYLRSFDYFKLAKKLIANSEAQA